MHLKRGGLCCSDSQIVTKAIKVSGQKHLHMFAKLGHHEHRLCLAVAGAKGLGKVRPKDFLLNRLHTKVDDILDGFSGDGDKVQEAAMDPMGEMETEDTQAAAPAPPAKKNAIHTIFMPEWPPEAGMREVSIRGISIYISNNRKQLWLHLNDVEWAIRYMFIQQQNNQIVVVARGDEGPGHDEKPEVADDSQCSTHDSTLSVKEAIPAHLHVSREWDEAP